MLVISLLLSPENQLIKLYAQKYNVASYNHIESTQSRTTAICLN